MTIITDLTDEVLHRLIVIIIIIKTNKTKKSKNKYTANSYIYITILVRFWKIFRRYFSVSGGGGGDEARNLH